MGVGQQVHVSSVNFMSPVETLLPNHPAVIGFDLRELSDAKDMGADPVPELIAKAKEGIVLTATWHVLNPVTGGYATDRSWSSPSDLLDPSSKASLTFWPNWDEALTELGRFQAASVPVIVYPLHEPGGDWFWWSQMDPQVYKDVFALLQEKAAAAGVHNLLWGYAAAPLTRPGILDPALFIPARVDIGGIDIYDYEKSMPEDQVSLKSFKEISAQVPRMALTEVGPFESDGSWDPKVIEETLRGNSLYATYALLWFDDSEFGGQLSGKKQLSSLTGGISWLASCPQGLCSLA
jgi:hypothetical protein